MFNPFQGLEEMNLQINEEDLFHKPKVSAKVTLNTKKEISAEDCLFDKETTCPCCTYKFQMRVVKTGKTRLLSLDDDLMPNYTPIQPMFYDIILCPMCGYAALSKSFHALTERQIASLQQEYCQKFKPRRFPDVYTESIAIERYKFALACATILKSKDSVKAYLCMRLAWLHRMMQDEQNEKDFMRLSLKGFYSVYQNERLPVMSLDSSTLTFLMAAFEDKLGNTPEAKKLFSQLLVSKSMPPKLRQRVVDYLAQINKRIPTGK